MGDVDEDTMAVLLSAFRIHRKECAVDDGSRLSVPSRELEFDITYGTFALELRHLPCPNFRFHEITGARSLQIFQRFDAEHLQKCRIGIDDLAVQRRNVNSLFQAQRKLAERARIAQAAKASFFPGLGLGLPSAPG